jgi:hypothetical protein
MTSAKHTLLLSDTGGTCDQCHESGLSFYGVTNLTTRPSNHHVGQDCKGCHSPNNWGGGNAVKAKATSKSTIATVVSSPAATQSPGRAATPAVTAPRLAGTALSGTATSTSGAAAPLSHAGTTTNCISCHNGVLAAGKGPTHIASNNACENCHTTVAWMPAQFDHRGVTAKCASCHNSVAASGKPTRHVQTTEDCSACHGTFAWSPATFSHSRIIAPCQSCHNGITATGKQAQHVSTTLDCGSCHNTLSWIIPAAPPKPPLKPLLTRPRAATPGPAK